MMRQANLCLGLIFLALFKVATSTNVCKQQGHDCTNAACVSCPPAFGVKEFCHEDTPTVCEPCVAEVNYSNSSSPLELCKRVAECAADHIVAKKATRTSDTQCVCLKGYVEDRFGICHKLQPTQYLTASPTTSTTEVPTGTTTTSTTEVPTGTITSTTSFVKYIIIGSAVFIILCIGVVLVCICIYRCCKKRVC
ncbi:tumor necrosis factor receptor superfamily member 14-like [Corticium candelabrum]|uniref:tumor necrosis factor receptor superfamily member 14-like n=1 Tax=Corticium candelabrum TaxID=121492 RepID=UPI002E26F410|nr:tumor necrosis factor receptor superfamily member 14-like [Corticium candelabrum]